MKTLLSVMIAVMVLGSCATADAAWPFYRAYHYPHYMRPAVVPAGFVPAASSAGLVPAASSAGFVSAASTHVIPAASALVPTVSHHFVAPAAASSSAQSSSSTLLNALLPTLIQSLTNSNRQPTNNTGVASQISNLQSDVTTMKGQIAEIHALIKAKNGGSPNGTPNGTPPTTKDPQTGLPVTLIPPASAEVPAAAQDNVQQIVATVLTSEKFTEALSAAVEKAVAKAMAKNADGKVPPKETATEAPAAPAPAPVKKPAN